MQRRRFGREFKVEAVRLIKDRGVSVAQAARDLDVHENVLRERAAQMGEGVLRGGRKRALGTRAPLTVPQGPNQRWSLDFVADQLVDGRRFRVLVVVDDFTRECLALVVDTSLSSPRVARELDALIAVRGRRLWSSATTAPS